MTGTADDQWRDDGDRERSRWEAKLKPTLVGLSVQPKSPQSAMIIDQIRELSPPAGLTLEQEEE